MEQDSGITFGTFDGFTWIRCDGKGSFLQSPALKECARKRLDEGETRLVVDLAGCTGMDSTFMGALAGLASLAMKAGGGVEIAEPGERNRRSLEDLGLDCLLEIEPADAGWVGRADELRGQLKPYSPNRLPDMDQRARHVLEAHQQLASTSPENAERFSGVLQVLEKQVSGRPATDG